MGRFLDFTVTVTATFRLSLINRDQFWQFLGLLLPVGTAVLYPPHSPRPAQIFLGQSSTTSSALWSKATAAKQHPRVSLFASWAFVWHGTLSARSVRFSQIVPSVCGPLGRHSCLAAECACGRSCFSSGQSCSFGIFRRNWWHKLARSQRMDVP